MPVLYLVETENIPEAIGVTSFGESFVVLDENEMPVYSVMSGIVFDEHHFTVRDKNKKVVGRIKKTFINPRIPGLYGKYRRCIIKISGEEKFGVSYEVGGDYGLYDTNMSLSANADETIFTITGCKNGKIKIGKQKGTSLLSQSRYVIGYDDEKNELRAIFIAICIRILRH